MRRTYRQAPELLWVAWLWCGGLIIVPVEAWEDGLGDWAGSTGESEPNGARIFRGAVENEYVWPPRGEGSRRREETKLWYKNKF